MRIGVAPVLVSWWKTVGGMKTAWPVRNQDAAQLQRVERTNRFGLVADHRQHQQNRGTDRDSDGSGEPAGYAIRPRQIGFANTQRDQRREFQKDAEARQQHV